MDWSLYHPTYGYYSKTRDKIGAKGDFFTSPHLSMDFGELVAEQLLEIWQVLGHPNPFTLVEMGAGQGLLASDVLRYVQQRSPECFAALHYRIIEKAAAHITEQRHRLARWLEAGLNLEWKTLDDIPPRSITGCLFSNELVDAFPVHFVTWVDDQLKEIYVSADGDQFTEAIADLSTPQLAEYFDRVGINFTEPPYQPGFRTEVNLVALDWIATVAEKLDRGYVLTIDYGYPAQRYYQPSRSQGTLQCYYQHSHHNDPYIYVGDQDITAHVDFTALQRYGEQCGLETVGFTQQGLFLMALGLGERFTQLTQTEATSSEDLHDRLRHRDALHQLINPMGLGGFGVLIQSRGFTGEHPELKGLRME
jgi:SAM-dependent MidA family methyltransferase